MINEYLLNWLYNLQVSPATLQETNNLSFSFLNSFFLVEQLVFPKSVHLNSHIMIFCLPTFFWVKIILPCKAYLNCLKMDSSLFSLSWYLWCLFEGIGKVLLCFIIPSSLAPTPYWSKQYEVRHCQQLSLLLSLSTRREFLMAHNHRAAKPMWPLRCSLGQVHSSRKFEAITGYKFHCTLDASSKPRDILGPGRWSKC